MSSPNYRPALTNVPAPGWRNPSRKCGYLPGTAPKPSQFGPVQTGRFLFRKVSLAMLIRSLVHAAAAVPSTFIAVCRAADRTAARSKRKDPQRAALAQTLNGHIGLPCRDGVAVIASL